MDCPVKIRLKKILHQDTLAYKITRLCLQHENHPMSVEVASLYPENRRVVVDEMIEAVCSLPSTRPMELMKFIQDKTQQRVLIHDVYNLKYRLRGIVVEDEEILKSLAQDIIVNGGFCKISVDESQVIIHFRL